MANQSDVRRIASSLPHAAEETGRFAFGVPNKGKTRAFVWVWLERVDPMKARVPNPAVVGIRVADLGEKELLLGANPGKYFTEPHYNGYPAILVWLDQVDTPELRGLLTNAWSCVAPKAEVLAFRDRQKPA